MRHLWSLLLDVFRGPTCGWCGQRVKAERLSLHWHIEHCGDPWSSR